MLFKINIVKASLNHWAVITTLSEHISDMAVHVQKWAIVRKDSGRRESNISKILCLNEFFNKRGLEGSQNSVLESQSLVITTH